MKKENWFKIVLIAALMITFAALYNDNNKINTLKIQLEKSENRAAELEQEKLTLQQQLDRCTANTVVLPKNGIYSSEQMDEMDRRIKEQTAP